MLILAGVAIFNRIGHCSKVRVSELNSRFIGPIRRATIAWTEDFLQLRIEVGEAISSHA
jgi:hypothetical protein